MKQVYINKDSETIYVELSEALDPESNHVGQTWDDYRNGAWVLLTNEQLTFKEDNPDASVEEVFKLTLNPVPEPDPEPELSPEERLNRARQEKIWAISEQDRSTEQFTVNGIPMWLDKNTRTSLVANTLPAEKAIGNEQTTLWYTGQPPIAIPVPINWLEEKLGELELYAKATYDTTQSHLAAVYSLETVEEIESYDITTGYPAMKEFVLSQKEEAES